MAATHIEQTIEDPDGRAQRVMVNLGESPLAWLHARGHVSERQYLAGERLRGDWEKAGLGARVTMCWDAAPREGGRRGRLTRPARSYRRANGSTARSRPPGRASPTYYGAWCALAKG